MVLMIGNFKIFSNQELDVVYDTLTTSKAYKGSKGTPLIIEQVLVTM